MTVGELKERLKAFDDGYEITLVIRNLKDHNTAVDINVVQFEDVHDGVVIGYDDKITAKEGASQVSDGAAPPKKDYEVAVDNYEEAHRKYKEAEERFLSGAFFPELRGDVTAMQRQYQDLVQELKDLLEERNVRLKNAADALRQSVLIAETQWRNAEGKATVRKYGSLTASSVTWRSFDPKSLFDLAKKHGIFERLLELKSVDKDGKEYKLVEQKWNIDYEGVYGWLKQHNFTEIINGAYDEHEKTPQVKGAKPLAFLGEKKD